MPKKVKCPMCFGHKSVTLQEDLRADKRIDCPTCNGTGWKRKPKPQKEKHDER